MNSKRRQARYIYRKTLNEKFHVQKKKNVHKPGRSQAGQVGHNPVKPGIQAKQASVTRQANLKAKQT